MKVLILFLLTCLPSIAFSRNYDTYRSDTFKGAFCEAIGGACVSDTDPVTALFQNPAGLATGDLKWDFDGDYTKTNSALTDESVAVGGIGYSPGPWGLGLAISKQKDHTETNTTLYDTNGNGRNFASQAQSSILQIRIPYALQISKKFSVGITATYIIHSQYISLSNSPAIETKPSANIMEFTFGGLYSLSNRLRVGSWFRLPKTLTETVELSNIAAGVAYKEEYNLHYPWIWSNGAALTLNPSVMLFLQVDTIGTTPNGYQLSYTALSNAPNDANLTPQGRNLEIEPHLGSRFILNSKFTLHAGTYYEARSSDTGGRAHGTGGISWKIFNWLEILGGIDIAKNDSKILFTLR